MNEPSPIHGIYNTSTNIGAHSRRISHLSETIIHFVDYSITSSYYLAIRTRPEGS